MRLGTSLTFLTAIGGMAAAHAQPSVKHVFFHIPAYGRKMFNAYLNSGKAHWFAIYLTGRETYLDIAAEPYSDGRVLDDPMIALYNSDGILLAEDDDGGPGVRSTLSFGVGSGRNIYDGEESYAGSDGPVPPAGTYYIAVAEYGGHFADYQFDYLYEAGTTFSGGRYRLTAYTDTDLLPPIERNFGYLVSNQNYRSRLYASEVHLFEFRLTGRETFLAISTGKSDIDDTMIGLYDVHGKLIAKNDDGWGDGQSMLTFGPEGKDGPIPGSGTYFLGVGEYHTSFEDFYINVKSTGYGGGYYRVDFLVEVDTSHCGIWKRCTTGQGNAGCEFCRLYSSNAKRLTCLKLDTIQYHLSRSGCDPPDDPPSRGSCLARRGKCFG